MFSHSLRRFKDESMKCVVLTIILCTGLAAASSDLQAESCRLNITADLTLDLERFTRLKPPNTQVHDRLSWVTEISRPNKTFENCEYWLTIDNSSVREINRNAFDNLMIDGLEIIDENNVLFITPGSFNGLPILRHLKIRPRVLTVPASLPEHPTDHQIYQNTSNLKSLEFGTNDRPTFSEVLKQFPKLEHLTINFVPKLHLKPKSHLNSLTFLYAASTITHLEFINSQMLILDSKPFSRFESLTHLKFNNMGIMHLSLSDFQGLDNLEYLSFTTLYSFRVPRHVFDPLKKLKTLIMRGCVASIEARAFAKLEVELVDLSCNKLAVVKAQTFSKINATHFDLSFNEINKIHQGAFANSNIKYLYLWKTGLNVTHVDKNIWGLSESTEIIFDKPSSHSMPGRETCPPEKPFEFN